MAEIKLFLLTSIDNEIKINQYFPTDINDQKSLTNMVKISQHYKNCGDGCIQTKDFIYYYKTFVPLSREDIPLFLLFYCTKTYKEKNIENLCEELFQILDNEHIEESKLKNEAKTLINDIFLQYKNLEKVKKISLGKDIKLSKNSFNESSYERNNSYESQNDNYRGDPRFYSYLVRKRVSRNESDIDLFLDDNVFKTCSFDDFGHNPVKRYNDNLLKNDNFEKWKKLKKHYLIFSIILCILTYFLFPVLLRFLFN